ncbi:hypothetical protein [Orrella dioscoreae]|uniref:Uncharacterized protein n=1 Tax=Orrella dioscoreae TaxID=1851544 RepID=A0A1C3K1D0_9BURK|nr:hypothetical protein [Orrella dioscoreae]SBT25323.1 hypothetical protein ODI_03626 [Orrella dioscoreae]SOE49111.1 hypothetical protein ODI_R1849 [Orrella dioscoreae]
MRLTDFDWPEIILDLRRSGMGQHEIAKAMGQAVGESMVRQYLAGATPAHWRGEILLSLWEEKTDKTRQQAPRRPAEIRRAAERRPRTAQSNLMPSEHLPAVARAYGMTVPNLIQMLTKRQTQPARVSETLSLPGFE